MPEDYSKVTLISALNNLEFEEVMHIIKTISPFELEDWINKNCSINHSDPDTNSIILNLHHEDD
jgi:hypothetical protein